MVSLGYETQEHYVTWPS